MTTSNAFASKAAQIAGKVRELVAEWFELNDVFWIAGLSAVGYGVAQIYPPAAWIICGAALFWMGVKK
jgi:hypothetical protein